MATRFAEATGNWNDTAVWSATDGGATGASFPVAGDDVTIKKAFTVTVPSGVPSAATSVTISSDDAATLRLNAALTLTGAMTLTRGVLAADFDGSHPAHSWSTFGSTTSNNRTLTLGGCTITLTSISSTALNLTGNTNLTMTANTAIITETGAGSGASLANFNYNGLSLVQSGSGTQSISTSASGTTIANYTRTGTAVKTDAFSVSGNGLIITGTCTLGGNTTQGVNRLLITTTLGTLQTITAGAYVIAKDVVFSLDINLAYTGAASWTNGASNFVGMADGGTGAAFTNRTTPATQTATGTGSFTWSTHGWTSRVPLPQDDVVINNAFSGSPTITQDMPHVAKTLSIGSTGNFTLTPTIPWTIYGNLTAAPVSGTITWTSNSSTLTLGGRGAQTITTNGVSIGSGITISASGGSYTLQDDLTHSITRGIAVSAGTFVDNGKTITTGSLSSTGTATRTVTLTGTWNVALAGSVTIWNMSNIGTSLTLTATAVTINVTSTDSAVTKTFAGGGSTYGTLNHTSAGSAALTIFETGNTFAVLNLQCTTARTINLPASGTVTITGTLTLSGASGQNLSLASSTPGTATTIVLTNASTWTMTNLTRSNDIVFDYRMTGSMISAGSSSGADVYTSAETGTVKANNSILSGADIFTATETGSVKIDNNILSGTDAFTATETGMVITALSSSGSKTIDLNKTGTVISASVMNGADVSELNRTGIVISAAVLSGADAFISSRTGSVISDLEASATTVKIFQRYGAVIVNDLILKGKKIVGTYGFTPEGQIVQISPYPNNVLILIKTPNQPNILIEPNNVVVQFSKAGG